MLSSIMHAKLDESATLKEMPFSSLKRKTLSSYTFLWILTSTLPQKIQLIVLREIASCFEGDSFCFEGDSYKKLVHHLLFPNKSADSNPFTLTAKSPLFPLHYT